jgi:hypothetical protein
MLPRDLHSAHDVLTRPGEDDAERVNLVDARVSGIEGTRNRVESNLAGDLLLEGAAKGPDLSGVRNPQRGGL